MTPVLGCLGQWVRKHCRSCTFPCFLSNRFRSQLQDHRLAWCCTFAGHSSGKDRGVDGSQAVEGTPVKGASKAADKSADAATDMVT
jgi:hypothetical protein